MWINRSFESWVSHGTGVAVALLLSAVAVSGQGVSKIHSAESPLQEHYDAAETLQGKGDLEQAAFQYKLFLAEALHRVANGWAQVGEYPEAVPLFDEALALTPNNAALTMDYAEAALDAHDMLKAQHLAQELVDSSPKNARDSRTARLHWLLGQAMLGMDDNEKARDQFATAVGISPNFENQYALASAYLAMLDKDNAAKIFKKMLAEFGDTAQIHMEFGLAYGNADFPEEAIPEFRKTLARNNTFLDAHYSLGASYLRRSGDTASHEAEAEFRKELSLHPDDFLSYYELGSLAMNQHHLPEAVSNLTRAAALNSHSDDTFLLLGDVYSELGRTTEEESALRKAIQVCTDPSRNHYQIRGAHYELGLLLKKEGKTEESKKELQISQDLLLENRKLDVANMAGKSILRFPSRKTDTVPDPAAAAKVKRLEQQIGPAIADSFDNLGVITAQDEDYTTASGYFKQAAQWNPGMDGLDYNWGRAAFGARDYHQAVLCLGRYMQAHPEDARSRVPLGMSQFMLSDYRGAIDTLSSLGAQLNIVPLLAYAYAESLVKTGDVGLGVDRLEHLEEVDPSLAIVPVALGEAYAGQKQYQKAEVQLRMALRMNPADKNAKYNLALTLIALDQKDEAQSLLKELAQQPETNNPAIYYQLGKLQLDQGDTNAAITNLEAATKLAPEDNATRIELMEAYLRKGEAGKPQNKKH
ncbi:MULTISPECIES: tetratricopeptide repeat protein [Acidobacteriaceae]|uniref:tetratricopeptide repeat protein n=1 Tax=Acidobacteriaceae TaxID=204434 RepID=UPI00131CBBD3|nr:MULTISPECIES: tetratricopeptide repeat protein [Acidobacteriaceae]MDW5266143.1 tetratricopeptide repeat protein [Edaphobacter sp.]